MPELATAWVTLAASTRGMEKDITGVFDKMEQAATKSGKDAGKAASKGVAEGMKSSESTVTAAAEKVGTKVSDSITKSVKKASTGSGGVAEAAKGAAEEFGKGFREGVEQAAGGSGGVSGAATTAAEEFGKGFRDGIKQALSEASIGDLLGGFNEKIQSTSNLLKGLGDIGIPTDGITRSLDTFTAKFDDTKSKIDGVSSTLQTLGSLAPEGSKVNRLSSKLPVASEILATASALEESLGKPLDDFLSRTVPGADATSWSEWWHDVKSVFLGDPIQVKLSLEDARAQMRAFFGEWDNAVISPNVVVPGQSKPGTNPLAALTPAASGTTGRGLGKVGGGTIIGASGIDRVPIMGTAGEHMLTTDDVAAMGGQANVYAFRRALHLIDGGAIGSKKGLQPNAAQLFDILVQAFPELKTIGGVRSDPIPDHPSGRALDIMIPDYNTPEGKALGDQINQFIRSNAGALGIDSTIWQDTWKDFKGNSSTVAGHLNHIHAKVLGGEATGAALDKLSGAGTETGSRMTQDFADKLAEGGQDAAKDLEQKQPDAKGPDGSSLGQSIVGGMLQTLGLDGSVFSNPLEWPNVKSAMALANWGGGLLKGAIGGDDTAGGGESTFGSQVGGGALSSIGLPNITDFIKPMGAGSTAPIGTPASGVGTGPAPGPQQGSNGAAPLVAYNGTVNMGVDPKAMTQRQDAHMNQAWRKTMPAVRPGR